MWAKTIQNGSEGGNEGQQRERKCHSCKIWQTNKMAPSLQSRWKVKRFVEKRFLQRFFLFWLLLDTCQLLAKRGVKPSIWYLYWTVFSVTNLLFTALWFIDLSWPQVASCSTAIRFRNYLWPSMEYVDLDLATVANCFQLCPLPARTCTHIIPHKLGLACVYSF